MGNEKYLDSEGLLFLVQRLNAVFNKKVDKKEGFSLISDTEIIRLANVTNYDDTAVQSAILSLQNKVQALENNPPSEGSYDDTEIRNLIADCQSDIDILKGKVTSWDTGYTHSQSAHAPSNAQENVIESITVNGSSTAVTNKTVNITIPTRVSDLSDGVNYITSTVLSESYYNKGEMDAKLKGGVHAKGSVNTYADLPSSPEDGDMYNIITADEEHNIKAGDNVVWLADEIRWDNYGGVVDTSGLVAKSDVITNTEIEQMFVDVFGV